jgi:biotin synthase
VAAWKGLSEGPMLDEVCNRVRELAASGKVRPDASLGLIKSQKVADRLKEAGLECYGHNLESSKRFFGHHCTTHTYDDRITTIEYLKKAGIKICSGGIIGMGETREDRCDLAFSLREIGANVVPINFLNPIKGTPYEHIAPLEPLEILKTIACFRFILPRQEIMIAGGRTVNLRDLQSMVFAAGASALMVGNYLTTLNQPVERDIQMLKDLGLDPNWDTISRIRWPSRNNRLGQALGHVKDSPTLFSAMRSDSDSRALVRRSIGSVMGSSLSLNAR